MLFQCKKQFCFKQFSLAWICSLVLFGPEIGPYQMLPTGPEWTWKQWQRRGTLHSQSSCITGTLPLDLCHIQDTHCWRGWSYLSAEKQSMYSTAPANWATTVRGRMYVFMTFPMIFAWKEMQPASSRIWTHIIDFFFHECYAPYL